ncbi:MAG TPA: ABC transporter permease [Streptosporangiaceae bacterium]|jgi:NitT/TauT family transport system permease protein
MTVHGKSLEPKVGDLPGSPETLPPASWRENRVQRALVINALRVLVLVAAIGLWQLSVDQGWVGRYIASTPSAVWSTLSHLSTSGNLFSNVGVTLYESSVGFVIGVVGGVLIGFVLGLWPLAHEVVRPFIMMLNTLPRIALAPLFLLWFGIGGESKIALVVSLVVFIVLINTLEGTANLDADIVALSRLLGAGRTKLAIKVILPSTLPWIVAGMRLSIAYAISGAVVGEMFAGQSGIGYLIQAGSGTFNVPEIFAALVTIMIVAWIIDSLGRWAERRVVRWRPKVDLT